MKAEVPGLDPKEIQISLQEQLLPIKGEKRQEKEEKDERYHRVERAYGAFARAIRLPVPVDAEKVTASFGEDLALPSLARHRLWPSRHERLGQAQAASLPHLRRRGRMRPLRSFFAKK